MEGARPEFQVKVCTKKKRSCCIGKCAVPAFDGSILVRVVGACGKDQASLFGEQVLHFVMVEEFATLIQMHMLV